MVNEECLFGEAGHPGGHSRAIPLPINQMGAGFEIRLLSPAFLEKNFPFFSFVAEQLEVCLVATTPSFRSRQLPFACWFLRPTDGISPPLLLFFLRVQILFLKSSD